ncbi:MAG: DUF3810 domain-containing protein [bacterium]
MKSPTKLRVVIIGLALTFYLLLQLLSQFPEFVEVYYSNGLYPILTLIMSNFASQFSFSLSEVTLWVILLFGIPFIINRIKKKHMHITRILLNLITTFAVLYVWFYLFWGMNYYRLPLKTKLHLQQVEIPMDAFDSTFVQIIHRGNDLNLTYSVKKVAQINAMIEESYTEVLNNLGLKKVPGFKGLKTFTINMLLNKTTTSGWFSPFFHEVHYNSDLFIFELPFVIAHEKAHQMGYTNEGDANFLAHLVCINASDPLIQYSGYFQVLDYFFKNLHGNKTKQVYYSNQLNNGVNLDLVAVRERWRSHGGFISKISNKGYDLYLKANDVKEGIENYANVVNLIVSYYEKKNLVHDMSAKSK